MRLNEVENDSAVNARALSEAIGTLPLISQLLTEEPSRALSIACEKLLENCQKLFKAETCAVFIVRQGIAELEAHRGYTLPLGAPLELETLRRQLRYRVDEPAKSECDRFDGITGWIASNGTEFCANSWEEIRGHESHLGKLDRLKIWDDSRPFRCMFAVPAKLYGETIGILKVENKLDPERRGVTFDETDKELMRTLANCFSMAVENAYLRAHIPVAKHVESGVDRDQLSSRPTPEPKLADRTARLDHSNMARVIQRVPTHVEIALRQALPPIPTGPFDQVIIAGMGGSALPAEIILDAFSERLRVPLQVVRHYALPSSVNERSLVIVSSFSGNTEETLSIMEHFPQNAANAVVVTAGGRLATLANERLYPLIKIPLGHEPTGFQPRSAIGFFVTYFARVLSSAGLLDDPTGDLEAVPSFLRSVDIRQAAEEVASWLGPRIPIIYTDEIHRMSIARIAKIKFNENSKRPAFFNGLPEANHNEMIGFSNQRLGEFGVLYLHDSCSHPRIRERFYVMKNVLMQEQLHNLAFREWEIPGKTKIQKIFAAIIFADWCSYTLALLDEFDPTPVALVESFKQALASFRTEN